MLQSELEAAQTQGATSARVLPSNSTVLTAGAAERGKGEQLPHPSTLSQPAPHESPHLVCRLLPELSQPRVGITCRASQARIPMCTQCCVPCAPPLLRARTHLPQCLEQLWLPARDEGTLLLRHSYPSSYKERFCFSYSD